MAASKKHEATTSVLRIEGEMTIYRAAELKQTLLASLKKPGTVEVDLSMVTELDTAGAQLLLLAKNTAQAKKRGLRLVDHSPAVLDVLELLNLTSYFGDPLLFQAVSGKSK
jgi:anti-sigma B factor antagonist